MLDAWAFHSKFKLAVAAFLAALGLLIFHRLTADQWVGFNTWALGLYFGANVADAVVTKRPE